MLMPARISAIALLFGASACVQPAANGSATGDSTLPSAGSQEADWAAILRLEDEAKALAKASGCSSASQCRTAPVGNRACGGPRYYITYCAASTDSVALFRKLEEVAAAENEYNRKYQIVSTCEFRTPPPVGLSGGQCRAVGQ
ncbi:hypothetical protein BH23GEM1_BH23GEM1_02280 [soil metagenome]